jgi:peptide chain release factor subunit 3
LELPEHKKIFSTGYTCVMHLHTTLEEIEITHVNTIYDESKKEWIPANYLKSGSLGRVRATVHNYNYILFLV